ncbi:hypothetical protein EDD16DRAFT_1641006 [Pisolithus croceorrhizus]|nr:hypothetical protein EDD16DRAFT_1641006 [Pisolithus croceorrhizus]
MFIPIRGTCPDSALGPPQCTRTKSSFSAMDKGELALCHQSLIINGPSPQVRLPPHSTSHYLHEMSPITRSMARKGVRHYAPYNLRSRGPDQTLLDLSTLPPTPRTLVRPYNAVGAGAAVPALRIQAAEGNPPANANEFIYPDIRKAIRDGEPLVFYIFHPSLHP